MNTAAPEKRFVEIDGLRMAYVERGDPSAPPIVLQHGNPTSSYLWREVWPELEGLGRCIALDLIGMGDSDPLPDPGPGRYTFEEHARWFERALAALGVDRDVVLVLHDWGSALGFDWARRHPDAVRGIAYMEAIVRPLTWAEWPEGARRIFRGLRSPAGERMILEQNVFVERILPSSVLRQLTAVELAEYRRPFAEPGERRRPTLDWPRQLPIEGEPVDVVERVQAYADWLSTSAVPKLFVNADPGSILVGAQRETCRGFPNQREVTVPGLHFVQEDSGAAIGAAVAEFVRGL